MVPNSDSVSGVDDVTWDGRLARGEDEIRISIARVPGDLTDSTGRPREEANETAAAML